ncbi:hypothetical protein [Alteriqipengyuania lutimaris]|uniref:Uncharacterized protein n=1 Tax=Alteriqipengyuania lutimaris TaxID=1538146 RepID=A0A395LN17_9SPHN|nr:hypothetical protein [Alteriqipengyuania lutimaris]MBB3032441.1 hypothetical protein [Alteriqipengyuania lutimaris]RDS78418.1 hypothetical protein DL238_12935 [Alteriqipengyuania lutimaris]
MGGDAPIWLASALAIAGVAVLRVSWGRSDRSSPLNIAGWATLLAALVAGDLAAGEWGIAVTVLVATFAAFVALAFAATKPARKARAKTVRTSHRGNDEASSAWWSGGLTFTLAGPLALGASVLLALAVRALILLAGGAEADGNVAVLATVPLAWPILSFALLMMSRRAAQWGWVLGLAAVSAPFLLLQGGTV